MSLQTKDELVRTFLAAALVALCLASSALQAPPALACPGVESVPTERNTYLMPETTEANAATSQAAEEPKKREDGEQQAGQSKPSQPDNSNSQQRTRPYGKKKIGMKGVVA